MEQVQLKIDKKDLLKWLNDLSGDALTMLITGESSSDCSVVLRATLISLKDGGVDDVPYPCYVFRGHP